MSEVVYQNHASNYLSKALADAHPTTDQIHSAIAGRESTVLNGLTPSLFAYFDRVVHIDYDEMGLPF